MDKGYQIVIKGQISISTKGMLYFASLGFKPSIQLRSAGRVPVPVESHRTSAALCWRSASASWDKEGFWFNFSET